MLKQDPNIERAYREQIIQDLQRKQAMGQLDRSLDVGGIATQLAKERLNETNYTMAWTQLGMPKISADHLKILDKLAPEFSNRVRNLTGGSAEVPKPTGQSAVVTPKSAPTQSRSSKGVIGGQAYQSAAYNNEMPKDFLPQETSLFDSYKLSPSEQILYVQLKAKNLDLLTHDKINYEDLVKRVVSKTRAEQTTTQPTQNVSNTD
jgi:hypothetical protein